MIRTITRAEPAVSAQETGVAVVFPGQGSQRPGMAAAWMDHPAAARWSDADAVLGRNVTRLGLEADADELRDPVNCQVALYVHHAVLLDAWRAAGGSPAIAAGHSLGEYSALLAAGILPFEEGLQLVDRRARATDIAAAQNPGGMVACLGGDTDVLRAACDAAGVFIANDNAEGQLVVAGSHDALDAFAVVAADGGARVRRLDVGAAYHSPFMRAAVPLFEPALTAMTFLDGAIPVVANVDAAPHRHARDWPALLRAQLTAPVRWRESVQSLAQAGTRSLVELGASAVVTGLAKRIAPQLERSAVLAPSDLEAA
jgi:[acyl-carrier-protein] S-malonyltransferase